MGARFSRLTSKVWKPTSVKGDQTSVPKGNSTITDGHASPSKATSIETAAQTLTVSPNDNFAGAERHAALVFGASGISGWAVMQNLLTYPSPTTFRRIIGLTNRPLSKAEADFPEDDGRLELYSGIDLRQDSDGVRTQLAGTIPRLEEVTHVYYCGE